MMTEEISDVFNEKDAETETADYFTGVFFALGSKLT